MKKSDVIKLLGMLSAVYPNMSEVNEVMVEIWFESLKDIDVNVALKAIKKNILESPYPPTIADIRKRVVEVVTPKEDKLDASEAWGEVLKAIKTYGYYRESEALESMSNITRKIVKYMGWQEICHSEKPDVVRGQFLKMFETISKREMESRLLPLDFKEEINRVSDNKERFKKLTENMDMRKAIGFGGETLDE